MKDLMTASGRHRLSRGDIEVGVLSHQGMVRSENQDHYCFYEPAEDKELVGKGRLLVVCDGMGGHNGGTVASRTTVDAILETYKSTDSANLKHLLSASIDRANVAVREKGARDISLRNMGTTCVAIAARGSRFQVAHIGDSRAYLFREGKVERVTRDHTYLNDLIEIGLLTPEKAKNHPERNIITRCVGMGDVLQVDFNLRSAKPGDAFLLCSDGLYNHVEDHEMLEAITKHEAQAACQALVDLANQRGGEDNITVAIIKVVSIPESFAAANADEPEDAGTTSDTVTPVVDHGDDNPTPRTAVPIQNTDAPAGVKGLTRTAAMTGAVPRGMRFLWSLKFWLICIAIELAALAVLQFCINSH